MRIRTADPLHAMQVLYQLSYSPLSGSYHAGWGFNKSRKNQKNLPEARPWAFLRTFLRTFFWAWGNRLCSNFSLGQEVF